MTRKSRLAPELLICTLMEWLLGRIQLVRWLAAFALSLQAVAEPIRPLLYEVQMQNQPKSYVLGTSYVPNLLKDLPPQVTQLIAKADVVVFETDSDELARVGQKSQQSLKAQLSPGAWSELVRWLKPAFNEQEIDHLEPWLAVKVFKDFLSQVPFPNDHYLTSELLQSARARSKKIRFLNKTTEHVEYLQLTPPLKDIERTTRHTTDPKFVAEVRDLYQYFKSIDARRFRAADTEITIAALDMNPEEFELLIKKRYSRWLPRIESLLKSGNAFFAIGADHLNGPEGVLTRLKSRGYEVRRMDNCDLHLVPGDFSGSR